jgi:hypothetical protein
MLKQSIDNHCCTTYRQSLNRENDNKDGFHWANLRGYQVSRQVIRKKSGISLGLEKKKEACR